MSPNCIVVVTGDAGARARAGSALPPERFQVLAAADAEAARDLDLPDLPAAVVVDSRLPGEQAERLVRDLRQDDATRETPLFVLAGVDLERAALRWGASALLSPELEADELGSLVGAFLEAPEPVARLHAALAHLRDGRMSQALTGLENVAEGTGHSLVGAWARYLAAQLLEAGGNRQFAVEELDALLADWPSFWRARVRLGRLTGSAGDVDHAPAGEKITAAELDAQVAAPGPDILIADDSELALAMTAEVLQAAGFRVRTAADGKQALELARAQRPDLLVLDGLMPGMTGFDVCKVVKETLYPANPPKVFILSAIYTKVKQRHEATDLYKVDEVIAKPFDDQKLVAMIRSHLAPGAPPARRMGPSAQA